MMSLETIRDMSREAGLKAARTKMEPVVIYSHDEIDDMPPFPFPNLGDHEPEGWELVDELFCDSSGFGSPGEPALTIDQLKRKLHDLYDEIPGYGLGITQVGQFQIYLGVFRKV